jgi:hypothetical protein
MYLFTRQRRTDPGEPLKAMEWAVEATAKAKEVTGREIDAWTAVMSPQVGTVVWSLWADHLAEIEAAGDALAADAAFMKLVEKGDDYFDGPLEDGLASLVHGAPDPDAPPPNYVVVATAVAAPGRLGAAITSGIEIADLATRVSGQDTLFVVGSTGPYGQMAWLTGAPDLATVEAGEAALMADPDWIDLLERVGTDYQPNAAQAIYRRIA